MKYSKCKSIVKKCVLSFLLFLSGLFVSISIANANSANLSGMSSSLMLADASTLVNGTLVRFLFTTYDGDRYSYPYYYSGGNIYYSRELKKIGSLYKTDYYLIVSNYIDDYGEISLNLYSGDSNSNGIDDVCEKSMYFNKSITGNWYSKYGTSGAIGGTFTKSAGYNQGSYSLTAYNTSAGTQTLTGVYYVGTLTGTISYNSSSNTVAVNYSVYWDNEYPQPSFSSTYEIIDSNHIKVNAEGGFPTTVFTRNGNVYSALVTLADGEANTFWADYQTWYISFQDNNDSDGDGIPDLSDFCPTDPYKIIEGICGCGLEDIDSDNDGAYDCNDDCPNDPNNDWDADDICGDIDNCPSVPNTDQANATPNPQPGDPGDACDTTDADNDGISDMDETICGSDPANPSSICFKGLPFLMLLLD